MISTAVRSTRWVRSPPFGTTAGSSWPRSSRWATSGLANLVPSKISRFGSEPINPTQEVTPGSVAVLDVTSWELEYITDAWLAEIKGDDLDLGGLLERYGF